LNKTGSENKKNKTRNFDYNPSKDVMKEIKEIQDNAKKIYKQNSDRIKSMSTYSTSVGNLPGFISTGYINSPTITTSSLSSSAITINGDPTNGSMRVDVPLIVNGRDVIKELDEMRDALLLLRRDVDMESKYPRLKELKDEYERTLEKYKTFESIKESK